MKPRHVLILSLAFLLLPTARSAGATRPGTPATQSASERSETTPPKLRLDDTARPVRYTLDLTVVPTSETFSGTVEIDLEFRKEVSVLWLNGTGLTVREAYLQSSGRSARTRPIAGGEDFLGFGFDRPVGPGSARLHVAYSGPISDKERGGLFRRKEGSDWYAFTQFEPIDARRAVPCFDEPAFKVPWKLTLHVKKELVAVSNTPPVSETQEPDGMKSVRFAETRPLPSYLVAFAVGPFEIVNAGKAGRKHTPVRILTPRGRAADAQYAAETSPGILRRLEEYFGTPYPYEKLDLVAVPQFGFGGMENPGLVAVIETSLLGRPETQTIQARRGYANLCAHELAHQWFGDLVTMTWWDDIWLNEAFASWMATKIVGQWKPEWEVKLSEAGYRAYVMDSDSLATARRVREPIATKHDIENAFDNITYDKGAAVLEMFESWIGPEKFRKGIRRYLSRHAWGNATFADFLAAQSEASGVDVAAAFSSFVDQTGVPLVTLDLRCEKGAPARIVLGQERYRPVGLTDGLPQAWHVPISVQYPTGGRVQRAALLLKEKAAEVQLPATAGCPRWVLANPGQAGYYRVLYRGDLLRRLLKENRSLTLSERIGVTGDIRALVKSGKLPAGEALALIPDLLQDGNRHLVNATAGILFDLRNLVPEELRPNFARFVRSLYGKQARALGWARRPEDDDETQLLRTSLVGLVAGEGEDEILIAEAGRLARLWLDDHRALDADAVPGVLRMAARHGGRALFDRLHEAARTTQDPRERGNLLFTLGCFRDPEILRAAHAILLTDEFHPRDAMRLLYGAGQDLETRRLAYDFLKRNFDALAARLPQDEIPYLPYNASGFAEPDQLADVEAFFKERTTRYTGGPRILAQVLEQIRLNGAFKRAQSASLKAFLSRQ